MFQRIIAALVVLTTLTAFAPAAYAQKDEIYTSRFSNLAVDGYDPVAYFTQGTAVKGSSDYELIYEGVTWRFSSDENLSVFEADPTSFAPQYGGYCAWAAAEGYTARGNPKNWTILDGKLYLNYNAKIQAKWLEDPAGFIEKADANWPGILAK